MPNISGKQPDVQYCPACKEPLRNVPRSEMISQGYKRKDGTVSPDTHTNVQNAVEDLRLIKIVEISVYRMIKEGVCHFRRLSLR